MDYRESVVAAARELGFIDPAGKLVPLDSLMIVDLIIALEDKTGVEVPADAVSEQTFASIETITAMLESTAGASATA